MALNQNTTVVAYGKEIEFPSAYIRVSRVDGDKNMITATVDFLASNGGEPLYKKSYEFNPLSSEKNVISQAYDYLKTLPEFADAVDC